MDGRLFRGRQVDTDDDGEQQTVTLRGGRGEVLARVPRVMPFGLHSSVPKGAHGIGLQFGHGGRTLKAVLGLEHAEHRPKKREVGSSALYDANGNVVSLVQKELRVTGKHATVVEGKDRTVVQLTDGTIIVLRPGRIDLGAESGTHAVMTDAGPSSVVFAKV